MTIYDGPSMYSAGTQLVLRALIPSKEMPVSSGCVDDADPSTVTFRPGTLRDELEDSTHSPVVLQGTIRGHNDARVLILFPRWSLRSLSTERVQGVHAIGCETETRT